MTGEHSIPVEFRAAGRRLSGPVVNYGERARDRAERFAAGAFTSREDPLELRLQHDPAAVVATTADRLVLTDNTLSLDAAADLVPGAALSLVERRALTGLSAEFVALEEHQQSGVRVIDQAHLAGIGLVDVPSYAGSRVELRARMGRSVSASIPSGKKLACECSGAGCRFAEFVQEEVEAAFDRAFESFQRDVTAVWARYDQPLGSVSKGTLRRTGPTEVAVDLPDDPTGRAVIAASESTGIIVRPYLDAAESQGTRVDDVMKYEEVSIRSFVVSSTDAREGWPEPRIVPTPDDLMETRSSGLAVPRRMRMMAWL